MDEISLHDVRKEILDSVASSWHRVDGPMFRNDFEWGSDGVTGAPSHSRRVVLYRNVRIALEWGFDAWGTDRVGREIYTEPWVTGKFPDPSARLIYTDVLFDGTLVDRVNLVTVDGSRAYMPQPDTEPKDDGTYGYVIDHWKYHLAALVNALDGADSFESYFAQTGIRQDF